MAASSSSSSSSSFLPQWIYDVFLSFRGEDTRKNFVDHLYVALQLRGIHTFKDDEKLKRGKSIASELLKAIKESRIAIIVFSEDYASSSWCLDELVQIIEWKNAVGQTVLPVFYKLDPSDVRKQTGSFAKAFAKHEETFVEDKEKVQRWRAALVEAANLSGWDLNNIANGYEAKFIQAIVQEITKKLGHIPLNVAKYQVGIDSRVNKVINLLHIGLKDVRIVGICGTGGVGKTTIAKAVYNQKIDQFESCCFLKNVREDSEKYGLVSIQKNLLEDILMEKDLKICNVDHGINMIRRRLQHKKVLVVIDDVNSLEQLESLVGGNDWFGLGSEIIITTRDKHVLEQREVLDHEIYMVEQFNDDEALQLFSWHAFTKKQPEESYLELSRSVINYAQGLPLALQVLGSDLRKRSIEYWEDELDRLKKIPNGKIYNVLKISFDGLDDTEKDLFLDIACFFKGYKKDKVMSILGSCGFPPRILVLVERSLITISNDNMLWMHDLIQEMGREIVRQESPEDPGKRSRLYSHKDIYEVLKENKGTETIQSIMLDIPHDSLSEKLHINVDVFVKMNRLKLLKLSGIQSRGGLTYLSNELCYLHWDDYPERLLPFNFHPKNLVELHLHQSQIQKIPMGIKFEKLKWLDLSRSPYLEKIPDLSSFPYLEHLDLSECKNLVEVHLSSGVHERLVSVNLYACKKLNRLPRSIKLKNLEFFSLSVCSKLEKFPEIEGDMGCLTMLKLNDTAIRDLPSSMEHLIGLKFLELHRCKKLKSVPNNIFSRMKDLNFLTMEGTAIKQLPSSMVHLSKLRKLYLNDFKGASPERTSSMFPYSFQMGKRTNVANSTYSQLDLLYGLRNLTHLALKRCNLSEELLSNIGQLSLLDVLDLSGNNFASIPASFIQLINLTYLVLEHCTGLRKLRSLPPSIEYVNATGCKSLEQYWFPPSVGSPDRRVFVFTDCYNMPNLSSQSQLQEIGTIILPGSEIPQWFSHKIEVDHEGSSIRSFRYRRSTSNNNVKGIIFCLVFEKLHVYHSDMSFKLEVNGVSVTPPFHETHIVSDHVILIHKTEYYDYEKEATRPIKNLIRRRPNIGSPNICHDESYFKFSIELLTQEAKLKKLGIHLVMEEEQADTSKHELLM